MKFLVTFIAVLFMTFQFSNSIICLIENCTSSLDKSINQIEDEDEESEQQEENTKQVKEHNFKFIEHNTVSDLVEIGSKTRKLNVFYLLCKYDVTAIINIIPPKKFKIN